MTHHDVQPTTMVALSDHELREWDWLAELRAQERSMPWLARRTGKSDQMVFAYGRGRANPPIEWLRSAALALGKAAA